MMMSVKTAVRQVLADFWLCVCERALIASLRITLIQINKLS